MTAYIYLTDIDMGGAGLDLKRSTLSQGVN
jgi:hypothetical protein